MRMRLQICGGGYRGRHVKSFSPGRGWLFPITEGPWEGSLLRLGWCLKDGEELKALDSSLPAPGGRYEKRPLYTGKGERKLASGFKGAKVPGVVYVWVPSSSAGADTAAGGVLVERG